MMPRITTNENGERVVVDTMSGKRYPPDEEGMILAQIDLSTVEEDNEPEDEESKDKSNIPIFLKPN